MAPREKPTFFLYNIGRDPEELCLGNLVLKDYANPTISRHYTHPRLNEDDLKTHARSTQVTKGWEANASSGTTFKPSVDVADLFQAGIDWDRKHERTLTADEGCRVVLKDPEKFLHQQVFSQVDAVQALQIWISGANRGLSGLGKKPKIWLLTGIYLLKDATFTGKKKRTAGIQAGVNSSVLSAVGAPPIGPSIDLGHSNDSSSQTPTQGWLVWAAQYRALDYRAGTKASSPADITLLYDVLSAGVCYYMPPPNWTTNLEVKVTHQSNNPDDDTQSACDDEAYQKIVENFWRPLPACNDKDYQKIDENYWTCKTSQWLTIDESFYVPEELTPEQQAKHERWQQAKKEMQSAGLQLAVLHSRSGYLIHTQDNSEEQKQLLHDQFMILEKAYKQALADFKSSLGEQALKGNKPKYSGSRGSLATIRQIVKNLFHE